MESRFNINSMEDGKVFFFKRGAISCSLREKFQIQTQTYIYSTCRYGHGKELTVEAIKCHNKITICTCIG